MNMFRGRAPTGRRRSENILTGYLVLLIDVDVILEFIDAIVFGVGDGSSICHCLELSVIAWNYFISSSHYFSPLSRLSLRQPVISPDILRDRETNETMNLVTIATIVFSTLIKSGAAETTCSFCPGVTTDVLLEIPDSDGLNCGLVVTITAPMFEEGTDNCTELQTFERYCCPSENDGSSCSFCEGVDELGDTVISEGVTCRDTAQFLPFIAGDSAECADFKLLETVCCPSVVTPPESPCSFCTGLDVLENVSYEGTSCETAVAIVGALDSTSEDCTIAQAYQSICCPTTPAAACRFCDGTTTMTSGMVVQDTLTCAEVADYAAWLESSAEECNTLQEAEEICCPGATTSPNSIPMASPVNVTQMPTQPTYNATPIATPTSGQSTPPPLSTSSSRYDMVLFFVTMIVHFIVS